MQLDCGARGLDLRPYVDGDTLKIHHGTVVIDHAYGDALGDVVSWARRNPGELVIIYASHCSGSNDDAAAMCEDKLVAAFGAAGIPLYSNRLSSVELVCDDIYSKSVGDALNINSVHAIYGCVDVNYNRSLSCYSSGVREDSISDELEARGINNINTSFADLGLQSSSKNMEAHFDTYVRNVSSVDLVNALGACYNSFTEEAFDRLWTYMTRTTTTPRNIFSMAQAHWQYSLEAIASGVTHGSCILHDEQWSGLNRKLAIKIRAGDFHHVNMLEVDNVCDHGYDVFNALRDSADPANRRLRTARRMRIFASTPTLLGPVLCSVVIIAIALCILIQPRAGLCWQEMQTDSCYLHA
jgi:hypothetical protein